MMGIVSSYQLNATYGELSQPRLGGRPTAKASLPSSNCTHISERTKGTALRLHSSALPPILHPNLSCPLPGLACL